ncbi:nucleotidyl transferase AbiEii/AbiGii toxin family protein [Patescibacteria group bacterium]
MNIFEKIFKEFNKAKIKYLVVGGVAVNLHGYVRFTGDLDLLLLLEEKNLEKVEKVMHKLGYSERLPVSVKSLQDEKQVKSWLKEKNMRAFSFVPPKDNPLQIDIVIEESLKFDKIVKDKVTKRIDNVSIPVVSIDQLIKMKRRADRQQDITDLEALIKLKKL